MAEAHTHAPSVQRHRLLDRRYRVIDLYLDGAYQTQIAQALGVSIGAVENDLQWIRRMWLNSILQRFDALKAKELAAIDRTEREAWDAWRQSRQPREVTQTEEQQGGDLVVAGEVRPASPKRKAQVRREGQSGDAAYLQIALNCSKARRELLGLDAPTRYQIDWEQLSDDQIERISQGEPVGKVIDVQARALSAGPGALPADMPEEAQE